MLSLGRMLLFLDRPWWGALDEDATFLARYFTNRGPSFSWKISLVIRDNATLEDHSAFETLFAIIFEYKLLGDRTTRGDLLIL